MVRMSKQGKRRNVSPRRPRPPAAKTGPLEEKVAFKPQANALEGNLSQTAFIPKIH